jgi:hypothetical protein
MIILSQDSARSGAQGTVARSFDYQEPYARR